MRARGSGSVAGSWTVAVHLAPFVSGVWWADEAHIPTAATRLSNEAPRGQKHGTEGVDDPASRRHTKPRSKAQKHKVIVHGDGTEALEVIRLVRHQGLLKSYPLFPATTAPNASTCQVQHARRRRNLYRRAHPATEPGAGTLNDLARASNRERYSRINKKDR